MYMTQIRKQPNSNQNSRGQVVIYFYNVTLFSTEKVN